jgi:hypothetical protein
MTMSNDIETLSLDALREERTRLQDDDDRVSYVRRAAQARLDLVRAERERRSGGGVPTSDTDLSGELRRVLSQQLTGTAGGGSRPPREDRDDLSDGPLSAELDQLCTDHGFYAITGAGGGLDDAELALLEQELSEFERRVSADRRQRFERIDALGTELVRRYREGEASIDSVLAED